MRSVYSAIECFLRDFAPNHVRTPIHANEKLEQRVRRGRSSFIGSGCCHCSVTTSPHNLQVTLAPKREPSLCLNLRDRTRICNLRVHTLESIHLQLNRLMEFNNATGQVNAR